MSNKKVYESITNKIIDMIELAIKEKRSFKFFQTWDKKAQTPVNFETKKEYNGSNLFFLSAFAGLNNFQRNKYLTFNQIKKMGGKLIKGSKGCPILFFTNKTIEDSESGEEKEIFIAKSYTVFNIEQTENIEKGSLDTLSLNNFQKIESAEKLIKDWKDMPKISFNSQRAFYAPTIDFINMPKPQTFTNNKEYYAVLFHEMIHSTGHKDRLNRKMSSLAAKNKQNYAKEELIAELGANFLCSKCDIDHYFENSLAYLQSWLKPLKNDSSLLIKASKKAVSAVEYITNKKEV